MPEQDHDLKELLLEYARQTYDVSWDFSYKLSGVKGYDYSHLGYVTAQLIKSATSPLINYTEALSARSRSSFLHKLTICLKDLRESQQWLTLMARVRWNDNDAFMKAATDDPKVQDSRYDPDAALCNKTIQQAGELIHLFEGIIQNSSAN